MATTKVAEKDKTRLEYVMDKNIHRPKQCQKVFLEWVSANPEFRKRRPTIEEVVTEARRPGSPLNIILEQNHRKAAEKYWYTEAQHYLRHINVVRIRIHTREILTKPVRAYVPIKFEKNGRVLEQNYVTMKRVADSPTLQHTILKRAEADFLAWMERYERYAEFLKAFSPVITAFREQVQAQLSEDVA